MSIVVGLLIFFGVLYVLMAYGITFVLAVMYSVDPRDDDKRRARMWWRALPTAPVALLLMVWEARRKVMEE